MRKPIPCETYVYKSVSIEEFRKIVKDLLKKANNEKSINV